MLFCVYKPTWFWSQTLVIGKTDLLSPPNKLLHMLCFPEFLAYIYIPSCKLYNVTSVFSLFILSIFHFVLFFLLVNILLVVFFYQITSKQCRWVLLAEDPGDWCVFTVTVRQIVSHRPALYRTVPWPKHSSPSMDTEMLSSSL